MVFKWLDKKIPLLKWYDFSLIKIGSAAFALFVASLWPQILILEWYWYLAIYVVAVLLPVYKVIKA